LKKSNYKILLDTNKWVRKKKKKKKKKRIAKILDEVCTF
jgi:hypothetical protein